MPGEGVAHGPLGRGGLLGGEAVRPDLKPPTDKVTISDKR